MTFTLLEKIKFCAHVPRQWKLFALGAQPPGVSWAGPYADVAHKDGSGDLGPWRKSSGEAAAVLGQDGPRSDPGGAPKACVRLGERRGSGDAAGPCSCPEQ